MGTQGPGRKRIPNRDKMTAEDDALNQIAREAEARLAAKRAARAEAREIRMKELERQQKEVSDDEEKMSVGSRGSFRVEERPERDFVDKGSRAASTLSAATLASLGGASSRRGSCDTSFSVETEASIRDMKDSLSEAEEKYRRAMVSNAQLHNEKSTLMFQVETLKEELSDMEELLWESRRHCEDQTKELERGRQAQAVLQFQFKEMKETLRQTEDLLTEVSDLRLKSSTYSQEVSDLQEVLQWKEKKMAALERQTEISDIVRIDRERLRDEVVRLTDLLKKHGVVVSPELSTNGETGRGEDDVSAQSATRLAEEPCHGGRESMLGPAEGSKAPQDDRKFSHWISQSLNLISTSDQTKPGAVKLVNRFDKQVTMEQPVGRTEGERKIPRNKGSEKKAKRKPPDVRRDRKSLFGNEGVKKQQKKTERGSAAEMCEPRLNFNDQPLKGRSKPHRESVPANQDVLVTEMERSFVLVHRTESQDKRGDLVSPVCRTSAQKVPKSRLVPPRPVKDIILGNKVIVSSIAAAVKQDALTQDKPKVDVSAVMRNERDSALKCSSAADDKDVNACRDVSCLGGEVMPDVPSLGANQNKMNEFITPTSADRMKENEFVDHMVELDGEGFKEEDSNVVTNLVENEMVATTIKISQSLEVHHQQTVSENLQSTINEDKVLKTKLSPNLETKPSELNVFLPAEQAIVGAMSGSPEKLENWRTSEEEPVREAVQDVQRNSEQCNNQRGTQKSTLSPFVPAETPEGRSVLEKTIQSMLRGFVENQVLAAAISRSFPCVQTNDASVDSRKVCKDVQDPPPSENTSEVMLSIREFKVEVNESSPEEKPAVTSIEVEEEKQSQSNFMVTSCSDFVFVESYFAEPEAESGSHLSLVSSSRNHAVNHQTNKQRETVGRSQSCSVIPVEEVVERQFKKYRTLSTNSHVGQSSKFRRLLEMTADEIKAMAVPELVLMNQRAGRVAEDRQSYESTGSEELEELSFGDMDSCEEVDEEAAQQPAMQQQPVMEDVDEDVKVIHLRGQKGLSLDFKKDRHRTDCKIS